MGIRTSNPQHEVAYQEMIALLSKHAGHLTSVEMLAIGANMVGKLVALQDQRSITPAEAMEVVIKNLELGNQQALVEISASKGHA